MLFTTGEFLLAYLPVTLALFFLIARLCGAQLAAAWLVAASLYFYGSWRPIHVVLLAASILFNYVMGGLILKSRAQDDLLRARTTMILAVAVDLLVLAYFKYMDFLIGSVNSLAGASLPLAHIALPLGISFFTFTQIAYLVDVQRGKVVERSPTRYALFVTYFPHLVAGPVLHHAQMMPQFKSSNVYTPSAHNFSVGLAFVILGLAKKILIADSFAPIANAVFDHATGTSLGAGEAWRGVLAYTLQIYFDFSGYSDMAVGLSRLFNVRLPYNFDSPYKSLSIIEFWRRWHMTLSAFLRDYLYFALGGNRKGPIRRYANLLITMLLGGLWHGASWTFVVWGGLHGIYLMINHGWRWVRASRGWTPERAGILATVLGRVCASVLTLLAVILAWTFFRAPTFTSAAHMLGALTHFTAGTSSTLAHSGPQWFWIAACLLVARFLPNSQELIDGRLAPLLERYAQPRALAADGILIGSAAVLAVLMVLISESRNVTEFIYFNF